jgi:hypothetical protein
MVAIADAANKLLRQAFGVLKSIRAFDIHSSQKQNFRIF